MKKQYAMLSLLVGLFASSNAIANSCSKQISRIHGLSSEAKQQMIVTCEETKLAQVANKVTREVASLPTIDKEYLTEISDIAKIVGQTVKEVSAELNIAVNEFVKTPVGMLTAGLAVWYVTGDGITAMLKKIWNIPGGILLFFISLYCYKKATAKIFEKKAEIQTVKGWFGSEKKVRVVTEQYELTHLEVGQGIPLVLITFGFIASIIVSFGMVF